MARDGQGPSSSYLAYPPIRFVYSPLSWDVYKRRPQKAGVAMMWMAGGLQLIQGPARLQYAPA